MQFMTMKYFFFLFSVIIPRATAVEIRVTPGMSIQDAADVAVSGDTIVVEPGIYVNSNVNATYGVHITKSNIRLVGESSSSNKVIIQFLPFSKQGIGILFAPPGCEYNSSATEGPCDGSTILSNISFIGISVEGFPRNGIQTRRVDNFEILKCESNGNLGNGIYPTISTNGLIQDNSAHGSLDAAIWPTGCENVTVLNNEIFDSVLGLEISVSNRIWVRNNKIYNNSIGVALVHPNNTRTPTRPVMKDWIIEENQIYNNNRDNDAPYEALQSKLPKGLGVLLLGVSDHTVKKNTIRDNGTTGVGIIGYCTAQQLGDPDRLCEQFPAKADPSSNNNLISQNTFHGNGGNQDPIIGRQGIPGVDLLYIQSPSLNETGDGNCFRLKLITTFFAIVDGQPSGTFGQQLPNGCKNSFPFEGSLIRFLNRILTLPKIIFQLFFG